jgi:hypothetical protein
MANFTGALNNQFLEKLTGTSGNDNFYPRGGWDLIDGGAGFDTVYVQGNSTGYKVALINGVTYIDSVSSASASIQETQLINVELIQFDDKAVDLTASMRFTNRPGDERFVGGAGLDVLSYELSRASYEVSKSGNLFVVTDKVGNGGVDVLTSIERLQFKDVKLALDLNGNAGDVVKTLGAVFGATAIKNHPEYVGLGLTYRDAGMSYQALMALALKAANLTSPESIVAQLWLNVMRKEGSPSELQPFVQMLKAGTPTEDLGVLAANTAQNLININLVGLTNSGVVYS